MHLCYMFATLLSPCAVAISYVYSQQFFKYNSNMSLHLLLCKQNYYTYVATNVHLFDGTEWQLYNRMVS